MVPREKKMVFKFVKWELDNLIETYSFVSLYNICHLFPFNRFHTILSAFTSENTKAVS